MTHSSKEMKRISDNTKKKKKRKFFYNLNLRLNSIFTVHFLRVEKTRQKNKEEESAKTQAFIGNLEKRRRKT
jgi:hypothetical protein